jgi:pre-rRNA-processing protein TSR4
MYKYAFFDKTSVQQTHTNVNYYFRYGRYSEPLILQTLPKSIRGHRCQYCDGELVFEMQLLPALLSRLSLVAKEGECVMGESPGILEFGTVLIYTCRDSCWEPEVTSHREEKIIVQAETL